MQTSIGATAAASAVAHFLEEISVAVSDPTVGAQQVRLLLALYTYGSISQAALDRHTGIKGSGNSRNIAKLGIGESLSSKPGLGLVESFEDLTDRRGKTVRLTPRGLAVVKTALERSFQIAGAN